MWNAECGMRNRWRTPPLMARGRVIANTLPLCPSAPLSLSSLRISDCGLRIERRRSGFSLAELMIAISIFGVGMLMVATTFPVGIDQARIAAE